jgi:hypothetical protein
MPNLIEETSWTEDLYRIELTDPVEGGEDGIDNVQAKQLGRRTRALRAFIDAAFAPAWISGVASVDQITLPPVVGGVLLGDGTAPVWIVGDTVLVNAQLGNLNLQLNACNWLPQGALQTATLTIGADFLGLTIQHEQAASGIGRPTSIRSQRGAAGSKSGDFTAGLPAGGTLGAKHVLEVGQRVGNVSDPVSIEADGTQLAALNQTDAGYVELASGPSLVLTLNRFSGRAVIIGNPSVFGITVSSGNMSLTSNAYLMLVASQQVYEIAGAGRHESQAVLAAGWGVRSTFVGRILAIDAATTNLWTWTIPSGEAVAIEVWVTVRNTTDGSVTFHRTTSPGVYRNDAGTVTEAAAPSITESGDAVEGGEVGTVIDTSGTSLRVKRLTGNAKNRSFSFTIIMHRSI